MTVASGPGQPPSAQRQPLADIVAEGRRILAAIGEAGVSARAFGGVAVALHEHEPLPAELKRPYADIDLIVASGQENELRRVLETEGYTPDRKFNALYGYKRQLFWDEANGRQLDVFIGRFEMCHALELDGRLDDPSGTLRPADLLLTKLQIVELNSKDVIDALALIDEHAIGQDREADVIGTDRIVALTAADWGWFTTASETLTRLDDSVVASLEPSRSARLHERIRTIRKALDASPKSLRWRARARIGRRMPWYELPEEHIR